MPILQCWRRKPRKAKLFCQGHTAIVIRLNWGDLNPRPSSPDLAPVTSLTCPCIDKKAIVPSFGKQCGIMKALESSDFRVGFES